MAARTLKEQMIALEAREDELNALLANRPAAEPALHPNLAHIYREKVAALHEALADPATKDEAFSIIRTLIDEVRLVPENGELRVEIRGALAGILSLSATNNKTARVGRTVLFLFCYRKSSWLRGHDLNVRPSGYEPDELLNNKLITNGLCTFMGYCPIHCAKISQFFVYLAVNCPNQGILLL